MPRVRVTVPDDLLQTLGKKTEELDKSISELFTEAIARYIAVTKNATPGSLRSRARVGQSSSQLGVEIPEALFQSADKLAKRLGKRREVLYCEALARHLSLGSSAPSALEQGHDLPARASRLADPE